MRTVGQKTETMNALEHLNTFTVDPRKGEFFRKVQLAIIKSEMARCYIMYDNATPDVKVLHESVPSATPNAVLQDFYCQFILNGYRRHVADVHSFADNAFPESIPVLRQARADRCAGKAKYS